MPSWSRRRSSILSSSVGLHVGSYSQRGGLKLPGQSITRNSLSTTTPDAFERAVLSMGKQRLAGVRSAKMFGNISLCFPSNSAVTIPSICTTSSNLSFSFSSIPLCLSRWSHRRDRVIELGDVPAKPRLSFSRRQKKILMACDKPTTAARVAIVTSGWNLGCWLLAACRMWALLLASSPPLSPLSLLPFLYFHFDDTFITAYY